MVFHSSIVIVVVLAALLLGCAGPVEPAEPVSPYAAWKHGPPTSPRFFPIMVWAQDPALAPQYRELGINTYMALWQGPTAEQLDQLREHGMYVICAQNDVGLNHLDDPMIIAWMHGDEPDNHKPDLNGPVPLDKILGNYVKILKQGVANPDFTGRAIDYDRYPLYAQGSDIVSYDVYPVANLKYREVLPDGSARTGRRDNGADHLALVAVGVDRLREWTGGNKPVWNVLECTAISHPKGHKVTPHQVRAEVWMSLIHGSTGLCWFVHDFREGHRNAAALLADEEMAAAVAANNELVLSLAPVLNSPTVEGVAEVASSNPEVPIDIMVKQLGGATYIFAAGMRNAATQGAFSVKGAGRDAIVEVIGEDRIIEPIDGEFTDEFAAYDVHLYKIHVP